MDGTSAEVLMISARFGWFSYVFMEDRIFHMDDLAVYPTN